MVLSSDPWVRFTQVVGAELENSRRVLGIAVSTLGCHAKQPEELMRISDTLRLVCLVVEDFQICDPGTNERLRLRACGNNESNRRR
jgi:hypothetical protein